MNADETPSIPLLATTAFGLEAVVTRELRELGYESRTVQPGRVRIEADLAAICRLNIHLRTAERVLLEIGTFPANDFGELFDRTNALPWEQWIPASGAFPVRGRSVKSQLSSVPACQRMVKKAVAERLLAAHGVAELPEDAAEYAIEVALLKDEVTLTLDTSGAGLHKRGYRPIAGKAALRETLAAAMVQLSFWKPDRPLIDPFCGTGTIPIEAAMIGRKMAPGVHRKFAAESWDKISNALWQETRDEAKAAVLPSLPERIRGMDIHDGALSLARRNADQAGVADDIHFQNKSFRELSSKKSYGCVITNPPYGQRMGEAQEIFDLYRSFPAVLRRLPTWSHYVITAFEKFEEIIGQKADRRRKLYNGRIECQYYQFHGPRPGDKRKHQSTNDAPIESQHDDDAATSAVATSTQHNDTIETAHDEKPPEKLPAFGGLKEAADRQATEFANRLRKRARHLRRWPKRGVTCFRLYEKDIPEVPLAVDRYEECLHIAEFARPHDRSIAEHHDWLDLMVKTAGEALEVHPSRIFVKFRDRQRGKSQYERRGDSATTFEVQEAGLRFKVNLSDYIDTGLFLDHRLTRQRVRDEAEGCNFLNLFAYTGSFTVYAAAGGAKSTTTVDLSRTYLDWAQDNLALNDLISGDHTFVRSDTMTYLRELPNEAKFDLAVVDPPTFSNSKDLADWDVQRDHMELLSLLLPHISPGGTIYFSTNFRRFKLCDAELSRAFPGLKIRDISAQSVPEDFRNRRIHRCWKIQVPAGE